MARGYIYTNKKHTVPGIMSSVFGAMSFGTFLACIVQSYKLKGVDVERFGTSALLAIIFMIVGYGLAIYAFIETDRLKLFKILGIVLNSLALISLSAILYAGAML